MKWYVKAVLAYFFVVIIYVYLFFSLITHEVFSTQRGIVIFTGIALLLIFGGFWIQDKMKKKD